MANSAAGAMRRLILEIDDQHDQFACVIKNAIEMLASLSESGYDVYSNAFVKEKMLLEDHFMYENEKEFTRSDPNRVLGYTLSKTVMLFARDWARNQKEKKSGKNYDVITLSFRDESPRAAAAEKTQLPAAAAACGCNEKTTPLSAAAAASAATLQSAAGATTTALKSAEATGKAHFEDAYVKDEVVELASSADQDASQLPQASEILQIDLEEPEVSAATVQLVTAAATAVDEQATGGVENVDSVDSGRTARGPQETHCEAVQMSKQSAVPLTIHDARCNGSSKNTTNPTATSSRTLVTKSPAAGSRRSSRADKQSTHNKTHSDPNGSSRKEVDCDICGKKMLSFSLKMHQLTHLDANDPKRAEICSHNTCQECGRSFLKKGILTMHLRSHSKDDSVRRPYRCEFCGQKFTQATGLKRHMRLHSDRKDSHIDVVDCEICGKKMLLRNLKAHHLTHLAFGDPRRNEVDCDICGKKIRFHYLNRHRLTHLEPSDPRRAEISARYTCEECGRSFLQKSELTGHSRTHSDDDSVRRPCTCTVCGKQYTQPQSLKNHMKKHSHSQHPTKKNPVVHSSSDDKKEQNDHTITSSKRILSNHDDKSCNAKQPRLSSVDENKIREMEDTREQNDVADNEEEYFSERL